MIVQTPKNYMYKRKPRFKLKQTSCVLLNMVRR
jgi:hypothetical protein